MKKIIAVICLLITSMTVLVAQQLSTDIYLVPVSLKKGKFSFEKPLNITNRPGYDNQPWFSPDGKKIMFVSMPDTSQSELYEYTITDSTTKRLTETAESEFSPRYAPDGKTITMVKVNREKSQNFSRFATDPDDVEILADGLDSVGYYCWVNDSVVAFASLNNGMELFVYELKSDQFIIGAKGIGRCILKDPTSNSLIYTTKSKDKVILNRFNIESGESTMLGEGLNNSEDYVITPDEKILSGDNGKLYSRNLAGDSKWEEVADFSKTVGPFYRLAISPDGKYLALVSFAGKRP